MLIFIALMRGHRNTTEGFHVRHVVLTALFFMMVGTALELYLLGHYEDMLQVIPLACIGTSTVIVCILLFQRKNFLIGLFKIVLGFTALSGFYGTFLHLRANYEFEKEMKPTAHSWDLLLESLSGALPTLAPASMIVLALIGYSYLLLLKQK